MPYRSKPDHRDNTALKSQWVIVCADEVSCFNLATSQNWSSDASTRWGLHFSPNVANLGQSALAFGIPPRALFIAKFIDGNANDLWHGYPADPYRNEHDLPPTSVLKIWQSQSHLRPALIRKLVKGQLCAL
jgi:hypothetical protein